MRKLGGLIYILLISIALGGLYTKYFQVSIPKSLREVEDGVDVSIVGEASFEDRLLTLDVETNLIEGTTISINTIAFDEEKSQLTEPEFLHLKDDTSFTESIEIPEEHDSGFEVELRFSPDYPEDSNYAKVYGDKGQKLTGPFIHTVDDFIGKGIFKEAKTSFYVFPDEDGKFETTFGEPEREIPQDLGDKEIRLEVEATADDEYIYIDGKSNLLEAAVLSINIIDEDDQYINAGGYALTNPDGSFNLIFEYEDEYKQYDEKYILIYFAPIDLSASWIIEQYGVDGKKMKGNLVKDNHVSIVVPLEE